ncbi:A/G-specific adenine glycosylase [Sphingobacterium sp. Mn56C]
MCLIINLLLLIFNKLLLKYVKINHLCVMSFSEKLIGWYHSYGRDLPWRKTQDPYVIWLSEIILQQTRVQQGMPYFYAFLDAFPTVQDFADADQAEVLRLWQGLGYYSRARNMHKAAKEVQERFDGRFPTAYSDLLSLPGVGEYTAAAIASFSSNAVHAVLDGNVFRVLSRYFGIDEPINSTVGKKIFKQLAQELISTHSPGTYNHAIMDFGATVCKPKAPLCMECIFADSCVALQDKRVDRLPVKLKGKGSRDRFFHYFIIEQDGAILMHQRMEGDVWASLYEFPLIETSSDVDIEKLLDTADYQKFLSSGYLEPIGGRVKHVLSHQNIYARFYKWNGQLKDGEKKEGWNYFLLENLDKLAKHKLIFSFLDKYCEQLIKT